MGLFGCGGCFNKQKGLGFFFLFCVPSFVFFFPWWRGFFPRPQLTKTTPLFVGGCCFCGGGWVFFLAFSPKTGGSLFNNRVVFWPTPQGEPVAFSPGVFVFSFPGSTSNLNPKKFFFLEPT